MKTIAFYSPHLSLMGTEVTMYDFADYNEKILGNKSIIIYNNNHKFTHQSAVDKFEKRFSKVIQLQGPQFDWHWKSEYTVPLLDEVIESEKCNGLYMQKFGYNDGVVSKICKTYVLCAAPVCDPHGDVYAYVSEWLSQAASGGRYPAVPSMVTPLPETSDDLREELNIPKDALVLGRTGGDGSFNIEWVKQVISHIVDNNLNIFFLFQNTPIFKNHNQIKHVEPSANLEFKSKFINTCDVMIHARNEGESFGCACGEFSSKNKPIITFFGSKDRNHIKLLGDKGFYYNNPNELYDIIVNFKKDPTKDWNVYKDYNPERIMKIFNDVFLLS
jgi:hypothetical protein